MHISFSLKLGVLITVLTTSVSGLGLIIFYQLSKNTLVDNIERRLLDVGLVATQLLSQEDREAIDYLRQQVLDQSLSLDFSVAQLRKGKCGDELLVNCPTISPEQRRILEQHPGYLQLRQRLREVVNATYTTVQDGVPEMKIIDDTMAFANHLAYIQVPIPQAPKHDIALVIANNDDISDPLGNLYQSDDYALFGEPFVTGRPAVSKDWYFDEFCSDRPCMTAIVPILDANHKVLAVMGLDYQLDEEWGALGELRTYCYSLITIVLIASIVFSVILAAMVNVPLRRVVQGAQRLQERDFSIRIKTYSRDEFGYLAAILNKMGEEINAYANGLQTLVDERTAELEAANSAIVALNDKLKKENKSLGAELDIALALQEKVLPTRQSQASFAHFQLACFGRVCQAVCGDYLDLIAVGDRKIVAIGDVSEQGLETGLFMLNMRSSLRALLESGLSIEKSLQQLNQVAFEYLQTMDSDKHMTLSLLEVQDDGSLLLSGQHEDVLIVRESGEIEVIDTVALGFPLGLMKDVSTLTTTLPLRLKGLDTLVLLTNGVFEARNADGESYGFERVGQLVQESLSQSVHNISQRLQQSLDSFSNDSVLHDDQSAVIIRGAK